jgi:hypothetical protein
MRSRFRVDVRVCIDSTRRVWGSGCGLNKTLDWLQSRFARLWHGNRAAILSHIEDAESLPG